jgi:methanol--5-hydroxybenzimidazolylcobamide Co-methyltransferase
MMPDSRKPVTQMVYASAEEMLFGSAAKPLACGNGVLIGAGQVIPEVNFTLPPMSIREETLPDVRQRFREMVERILTRAVQQGLSAIVLELEHPYELTLHPDWGALVTADLKQLMEQFGTDCVPRCASPSPTSENRNVRPGCVAGSCLPPC